MGFFIFSKISIMKLRRIFILSILAITILLSCTPNASSDAIPKEGYVSVTGGKIWYKIMGEGPKTPLLLLHGGPGGTHRYFYELSSISKDRPIILFDQLGSGRSGVHQDTTLLNVENFVAQVAALRRHLALKDVYILGHSWGAALALETYQKHPEGIQGLIFSSPYVSTPIWKADADILINTLADSIQTVIRTAEKLQQFDTPKYKEADSIYWSTFGLRTTYTSHPLDTVKAPSNSFIYNYMWGPSEFTATGILKNYDNVKGLKDISIPTLFITGEYDEARPETVQKFQQMVPNAKFRIIQDAGHASMRDNTHQYLKALRGFLEAQEPNLKQ